MSKKMIFRESVAMSLWWSLTILSSFQFAQAQKNQFASNLKNCVEIDTNLDSCLAKTPEDLRSLMPVGVPELNLKPTEPLQIKNLKFKTKPGLGVNIDSTFTDVRLIFILNLS